MTALPCRVDKQNLAWSKGGIAKQGCTCNLMPAATLRDECAMDCQPSKWGSQKPTCRTAVTRFLATQGTVGAPGARPSLTTDTVFPGCTNGRAEPQRCVGELPIRGGVPPGSHRQRCPGATGAVHADVAARGCGAVCRASAADMPRVTDSSAGTVLQRTRVAIAPWRTGYWSCHTCRAEGTHGTHLRAVAVLQRNRAAIAPWGTR
jgi:hypothetical protein